MEAGPLVYFATPWPVFHAAYSWPGEQILWSTNFRYRQNVAHDHYKCQSKGRNKTGESGGSARKCLSEYERDHPRTKPILGLSASLGVNEALANVRCYSHSGEWRKRQTFSTTTSTPEWCSTVREDNLEARDEWIFTLPWIYRWYSSSKYTCTLIYYPMIKAQFM